MKSLGIAEALLVVLVLASPAQAQTSGGPDAYSYVYVPTSYDFTALATVTLAAHHTLSDDGAVTTPLPWSFPFYGGSYTQVRIGANGAVTFDLSGEIGYANQTLPSSNSSSPDIAVFWDDLNPGQGGGVHSFHELVDFDGDGNPEIDRFLVSWEDVPRYYNAGAGSFQLHLYPDGEIQFHWEDTDFGTPTYNQGASATIGIQDFSAGNHSSGNALLASWNSAWVVDGTATSILVCATDSDGDGSPSCVDCDDSEPAALPGGLEVCDGIDNDCDPSTDENVSSDLDGQSLCAGDCDDTNPNNFTGNTEVCDLQDNDCDAGIDEDFDVDGDGFVDLFEPACSAVYVSALLDCDDANALAYPGAAEVCDGAIDHDCDGEVDEGTIIAWGAGIGTPLPLDGVATIARSTEVFESGTLVDIDVVLSVDHPSVSDLDILLTSPAGTTVELSTDNGGSGDNFVSTVFDDEAETQIVAGVAPFTGSFQPEEALAAFDNQSITGSWTLEVTDDTPATDDGTLGTWRILFTVAGGADSDVDGFTLCAGDCNDLDPAIHPGAVEVCDGADNNCDGLLDEGSVDADGDGAADCAGADCDDSSAVSFPGAYEFCDGQDNDCNGIDDAQAPGIYGQETDDDGDGYVECGDPDAAFPGGDCNDGDATESPGLPEICDGGTDNDCDPSTVENIDGDGDSESICDGDCDDGDPSNFLAGVEACDGADNNCDGEVDEAFDLDNDGSFDSADPGCVATWSTTDCDDTDSSNFPDNPESCDSLDNNCDGLADELRSDFAGDASSDPITSSTSLEKQALVQVAVDGSPVSGFIVDVDVAVDIDHAAVQDVELSLISPGGTTVLLTSDNGGFGQDLTQTLFDDEAAAVIDGTTAAQAPFTGRFQPEGNLGDLDGGPVSGTWTLNIVDDYPSANDGVLNSWTLHIAWEGDNDGSYTLCAGADCDDANAAVFPGNVELCDGLDNDCNGSSDFDPFLEADLDSDGSLSCEDCDEADPTVYPGAPELCDGLDNDCNPLTDELADIDGDGVTPCAGDCDDSSAEVYPGAFELCDGVDNDCDGSIDAAETTDADGDESPLCLDCDDEDPSNYPGNLEVCDGQDNDCDPITDEGADFDGDGLSPCAGDCNDGDSSIYTGAAELCDQLDNDCDGTVPEDEQVDVDGDGSLACADCDDLEPLVFPGNPELCDGLDNDCDPATDEVSDVDGDGVGVCGGDCDDSEAAVAPYLVEVCDGLDNDCDPLTDEDSDGDGDGATTCEGDCDDENIETGVAALEICDGEDNDCDGSTPTDEVDGDADAVLLCDGDCDDADPLSHPGAAELCDGLDNDCDGTTEDEELDDDGDSFAPCEGDCDDTNASVFPEALEACDGQDTNCDGSTPSDEVDSDEDGSLVCEGDCDDTDDTVHPEAEEAGDALCSDGVDNDCDGFTDAEDEDCDDSAGDDDDSAGDDDDSAEPGDDDDSAGEGEDSGCECSASLGSGGPGHLPLTSLLLLVLAGFRRRRPRRR